MHLRKIAAIDDQTLGVEVLSQSINLYLEAEAIPFDRQPADRTSVPRWVRERGIDAVLIDQDLRKGNFGTDSGLIIAEALFRQNTPAVLTTMHRLSGINDAIWHRRYVPAHLLKSHLEDIEEALNRAMDEIAGRIPPERKAYRTVVRVDTIDEKYANLVIIGYDPHEWISVELNSLASHLGLQPRQGMRFMAEVNIGAPNQDELFISEVQP